MKPLGHIPAVMDEREAYTNLSESLKIAEAACRQMAFMRIGETNAQEWIRVAGQIGTLRHMLLKLVTHSAQSTLKLSGLAK